MSHMAGRSLPFHSPVRFLFAFFSEPWKIRRPLQLSLTPTPTLHSWISLHWISSSLHWACITHCTIICAVLTIDDLEGREACRSCSHQSKVKASCRRLSSGGFRGVADFCPWESGRNACVKHCFSVHLRSVSTHSSICFYFAGAFPHSSQPDFQLLLVRSSFFV